MPWREREDYLPGEDWWNQPEVPEQPAPPPQTHPNWTDPDNAPPSWLHDPNAAPPAVSEPGVYWSFDPAQGMWVLRNMPRASQPTTPSGQPPAPSPYPGGDGGQPRSFSSGPTAFQWPQFNAPRMAGLEPFSYKDFSYDPFSAPTIEQARTEPGFQFAFEQGQKALENAAAAKGVLRTGGTMKDLISWGQKAADQNYSNVYARAADSYDRNRANAYGSWSGNLQKEMGARGINWGEMTDTYDRNYTAAKDEFNPQFRAAELTFEDMYRRWRDQGNWTTQIATSYD